MAQPEPVFEAPWHADIFAVTVSLQQDGVFSWAEWVSVFSAELKLSGLNEALNGGDDYFLAWIAALERILTENEHVSAAAVDATALAWRQAYLATPHGQPVTLACDHSSTSSMSD